MSSNAFSLIVSIPGQEPTRHDLSDDSISFGRGPDNGIQVLVSEVSVNHGELKASGGSYVVFDKGSTNGTKVNGLPVSPEGKELSPMDIVLLGNTVKSYFVSTAVLDATPIAELIASIEESKAEAKPATAPVAVSPAKPAVRLPAQAPAPGASTVRLDQVRPGAPAAGPAQPKAPGAPAAPAAPKLPSPAAPGGAPAAPAAPPAGGPAAPKPIAPIPLKRPGGTPAPAAPSIPLPGAPPKKPSE